MKLLKEICMIFEKNSKEIQFVLLSFFVILISILSGCKSTEVKQDQTAETLFNKGVEYFKDKDWIEADKTFQVVKLQYPASQYADDAQYYMAEVNYGRGEYILASFNYNLLRRTYPTSEFVKISLYKSGLCYNELSPNYDRDQEYTTKAIETFQDFQRLYPQDTLYKQAGQYIEELRNKLAEREYTTAELYIKLFSPRSAIVYLDVLISDYTDTKYYELAYFKKIAILIDSKKTDEAKSIINQYKKIFSKGVYLNQIITMEKQITN